MIDHFKKLWGRFSKSKSKEEGYVYPVDESQFEKNPTKIRTSEVSQFQDEARDIESRSPERKAYDDNAFEERVHHKE